MKRSELPVGLKFDVLTKKLKLNSRENPEDNKEQSDQMKEQELILQKGSGISDKRGITREREGIWCCTCAAGNNTGIMMSS